MVDFRIILCRRKPGFTLIELLIVVAIIAILAAIAVPNFLEAQTRAKVSRAKADMRSMATAAETYYIDFNYYMVSSNPPHPVDGPTQWGISNVDDYKQILSYASSHYDAMFRLTSPVAYMSSLPSEAPFGSYASFDVTRQHVGYWYRGSNIYKGIRRTENAAYPREWYDARYSFDAAGPSKRLRGDDNRFVPYDPSNGTLSIGGIWYLPGATGFHSFI